MIMFLTKQLLNLVVSFFVLTLFTFSLSHLFPNGLSFIFEQSASEVMLGLKSDTIVIENLNLFEGYYYYIQHILTGDFGLSSVRGTSVFKEFFIYFPATLELSIAAMLFALALGLPFGILAAKEKNNWPDKLIVSTTLVGYSMPVFWWAMLLVLLFSLWLGITPVASRIGFEYDILPVTGFMLIDTLLSEQPYNLEAFYNAIHHLILPAIVLGTIPLAVITRSTRSAMISALSEDYIRSAKARGIPLASVVWKHALRNALIPIITVMGLQVSVIITGSLITESIFSWPGAGKWLLEAVYRRDFPVIHGGILAIASFVILLHLLLDIILMIADPKQRKS